jgi:hypothetical protein
MRIVIQLKPEEARALQAGQSLTPELQQLVQTIREMANGVRPVHPGATAPLLAPYFVTDAPNRDAADQLVRRLLAHSAVVAAYVEPPIAPG